MSVGSCVRELDGRDRRNLSAVASIARVDCPREAGPNGLGSGDHEGVKLALTISGCLDCGLPRGK
jgi:hypothetical protein